MVDFNNEATMATPATDVVKLCIIERWYNLIEALEAFDKQKGSGVFADFHIVKSRLLSLLRVLSPSLLRQGKKAEYEEVILLIESNQYDDIIRGFAILNTFLDEINLTRIDTKPKYNRTRVEEENAIHGA